MGSYTPYRFGIPNGLDETGISLGLSRLPVENLSTYRRRLLLEARDPSGPEQDQFIRSAGRKAGEFDVPVFEIDLLKDGDGIPLASDPYIQITSTYIRVYSDWNNSVLDFEHNIVSREDAYFLREVYSAFSASTFFSIDILDSAYTFKLSSHLRFDTTERFVRAEFLKNSRSNGLQNDLVREIYPQAFQHFQTEVTTLLEVDDIGKFYVDYLNGVVFTFEYASGVIAYSYREFPYRIWWQPIRAWPYNDTDKEYRFKDSLISDETGEEAPLLLNSEGARIANTVLGIHPLGWGT